MTGRSSDVRRRRRRREKKIKCRPFSLRISKSTSKDIFEVGVNCLFGCFLCLKLCLERWKFVCGVSFWKIVVVAKRETRKCKNNSRGSTSELCADQREWILWEDYLVSVDTYHYTEEMKVGREKRNLEITSDSKWDQDFSLPFVSKNCSFHVVLSSSFVRNRTHICASCLSFQMSKRREMFFWERRVIVFKFFSSLYKKNVSSLQPEDSSWIERDDNHYALILCCQDWLSQWTWCPSNLWSNLLRFARILRVKDYCSPSVMRE